MTAFQIAMSWMIIRLVRRSWDSSFTSKVVLVCAIALTVATLHDFVSYFAFQVGMPNRSPMELAPTLRNILFWFGPYLGWSALFLALQYSSEVVERERQLSELRELAYGAQMRALRYQINPHFLFNTLNALATLIEEGEVKNAERMVLSLSAFLRSTLALDPMQDITLDDELDIQARYLDIERERFSDRLTVVMEVPNELRPAKVPSLILQPLVENAVKHGVGSLDRAVRIRISADSDRNILSIHIDNDALEHALPSASTGLGLRNVADRLAARFGEAGRLTSTRTAEGGFRATVSMPLRFTPC
jgi:LytS/YehU family sensor histidine kinase